MLICGKGGCGKSTVVALLSKEIAERKNKVLVIDSDESNIGLHSRLGQYFQLASQSDEHREESHKMLG